MAESDKGLVPVPDPTLLTTAALKLSIDNLKEFMLARIDSQSELLKEKIANNYCLDEKRHRETREWLQKSREHWLEVKADAESALDRAFAAAKELNDQQRKCNEESQTKTEQSFTKQIEAFMRESTISHSALGDRITILERLADRSTGAKTENVENRGLAQWVIGLIVAIGLALLGNAITLIYLFTHH